jgi:TPR repeat protein
MYYDGQGVPQDFFQAASWFRQAADQGDADAQYSLLRMYDEGLVPR